MGDLLTTGGILAAFFAGGVALFAPCCIVFLAPSYLAGAVKNRRWRLLPLTFLFAAGLAVVLVGVATAAAGPIAFVALAAPQIARRLLRSGRIALGVTFLVGGTLLAAADLLAQSLDIGLRTPVGLVTSLLGGVYLLWLLARRV